MENFLVLRCGTNGGSIKMRSTHGCELNVHPLAAKAGEPEGEGNDIRQR